MKRIVVLCANLSVDQTWQLSSLQRGQHHRPSQLVVRAGGKGANAGRVLRRLGHEVALTGFAGGAVGQQVEELLIAAGVRAELVVIRGESRLCVNLVDDETRSDTQIDQIGPEVTDDEVEALRERFGQLLGQAEVAVIAGSLPPGAPDELLAEAVTMAHEAGVEVFLDARDHYLAAALPRLPEVVKPNLAELAAWAGRELTVPQGVLQACRQLVDTGIRQMVVSLGARGAISLSRDGGAWWASVPPVTCLSAVGSGDAMLAGLVHATSLGLPVAEQLRWAVAAGTANVGQLGAAGCGLAEISHWLKQVTITELSEIQACRAPAIPD
jgi:tagatose 6-phosphate kinase